MAINNQYSASKSTTPSMPRSETVSEWEVLLQDWRFPSRLLSPLTLFKPSYDAITKYSYRHIVIQFIFCDVLVMSLSHLCAGRSPCQRRRKATLSMKMMHRSAPYQLQHLLAELPRRLQDLLLPLPRLLHWCVKRQVMTTSLTRPNKSFRRRGQLWRKPRRWRARTTNGLLALFAWKVLMILRPAASYVMFVFNDSRICFCGCHLTLMPCDLCVSKLTLQWLQYKLTDIWSHGFILILIPILILTL